MSRSEQDLGVQETPMYTEGNPLVWINVRLLERRIDEFEQVVDGGRLRGSAFIKDTLPLSLELYVALTKVSCLIANKLANPIEAPVLQSRFEWIIWTSNIHHRSPHEYQLSQLHTIAFQVKLMMWNRSHSYGSQGCPQSMHPGEYQIHDTY